MATARGHSLFSELRRRKVYRAVGAYIVAAWLIAQVAELTIDAFGAPSWVLPLLLVLLAIGVVPAIILAWIYELTPKGLQLDTGEGGFSSSSGGLSWRYNLIIFALVAITLGIAITTRSPSSLTMADGRISSIAVLPFEDLSLEGTHRYLGTGVADSVMDGLSRVPGLRVTARTSASLVAQERASIPAIAERLNVGAVLEGSIQVAGDRLRVIAQLTRTQDESQIWSQTFERQLTDIFALQDEITSTVASVLYGMGVHDAPAQAIHSTTTEVFELVARARHLLGKRTLEDVNSAEALLEEALRLDPAYAPTHALLALAIWQSANPYPIQYDAFTTSATADVTHETRPIERARARERARRAIELDPGSAVAHAVMGYMLGELGDRVAAELALRHALSLDPNFVPAMTWLAEVLTVTGDIPEANALYESAFTRDPLDIHVRIQFARRLLASVDNLRERQRGADIVIATLELFPESKYVQWHARELAFEIRDVVEQISFLIKLIDAQPHPYPMLQIADLLASVGDLENARAWERAYGQAISEGNWQSSEPPQALSFGLALAEADEMLSPRIPLSEDRRYLLRAWALIKAGLENDAIALLEPYVRAPRGHPAIRAALLTMFEWLVTRSGTIDDWPNLVGDARSAYMHLKHKEPGDPGTFDYDFRRAIWGRATTERAYFEDALERALSTVVVYAMRGDTEALANRLAELDGKPLRFITLRWADGPWLDEHRSREDIGGVLARWEHERAEVLRRLSELPTPP